MKYCPNCGKEIEEGWTTCPGCGAKLNEKKDGKTASVRVENKNIATMIILSIVTCGIYGIIWFINMVNDVNTVCQDEQSSQSGGTVFLLTLITCGIYGIYYFYQCGKRMEKAGQKHGVQIADNSVVYLLLGIFGLQIVNYCLVQSDLNKFSH